MFVYVIGSVKGPQKIGVAANPDGRLTQLRTGHPFPLAVHAHFEFPTEAEARTVERTAHKALKEKRLSGEWFEITTSEAVAAVESAIEAIRQGVVAVRAIELSPVQIRAARALIGWTQIELASASGVSEISIKNIERGVTDPRRSTLEAIQTALESAGVLFLDPGQTRDGGPGVRLK